MTNIGFWGGSRKCDNRCSSQNSDQPQLPTRYGPEVWPSLFITTQRPPRTPNHVHAGLNVELGSTLRNAILFQQRPTWAAVRRRASRLVTILFEQRPVNAPAKIDLCLKNRFLQWFEQRVWQSLYSYTANLPGCNFKTSVPVFQTRASLAVRVQVSELVTPSIFVLTVQHIDLWISIRSDKQYIDSWLNASLHYLH